MTVMDLQVLLHANGPRKSGLTRPHAPAGRRKHTHTRGLRTLHQVCPRSISDPWGPLTIALLGSSLPLKDNHITLSILPTLTFGKTPSLTIVPWSVYIPSERRAKTFAFDEGITYIDFLNYYCAWDMGTPGRIDYTLHIFQKPLIYGFATLSTSQGQTSFFFARILSSEEMAALPPL